MQRLKTALSSKVTLLLLGFLTIAVVSNGQLKIGDNPTSIQKSSILELESSRQGLLLPRLADTTSINALNPPDGMIIYLNTDNSLRLRSNGYWKKIADLSEASANWSLKGNSGTNPATNFIGTVDGQPLVIRTSNNERLRIDANGNVGIGTNAPTAKLEVNGTVKFDTLATGTNELNVLVLAADGSVYKRTMSSSAFQNAIKAINGIQKQTLSITAQTTNTKDTLTVENRSTDSTIALYLPVMDSTTTSSRPYGLLTYSDWQKVQSAIQTITIGAVATGSNVNGATISTTGTTRTITLTPADATNAGIVTAGRQTFGGSKTFQDSVTINSPLTLNSVANNSTIDSVLVINNGVVQKRKVSSAAFGNAIRSINNNRDTAQTFVFTGAGTDLTVSTNGTDSIRLNVPSASTSARGVVTTTTQTFGGNKNFQDSVNAAVTMKVGSAGYANSTVQVAGSISMAIRAVSANTTIDATDNTVLVNTTSGALTITLPSASGISGRIYTIKKIGTGGIDNQLTVSPAGGATIDGGSSYIIYNDYTYVTLQTDGTNWYIIKK